MNRRRRGDSSDMEAAAWRLSAAVVSIAVFPLLRSWKRDISDLRACHQLAPPFVGLGICSRFQKDVCHIERTAREVACVHVSRRCTHANQVNNDRR